MQNAKALSRAFADCCRRLARPAAGALSIGNILISNFSGSNVQQYSPTGTLLTTFTGSGNTWEGSSLTPDGNVVTTYRTPSTGIDIFSPAGTQITSFATPAVGANGDVSVFPDGILAISDQTNHQVVEYTQAGTYVRTLSIAGASDPFGNTIAPNGTLWVVDPAAKDLFNLSETGTLLRTISTSFNPDDLVVGSDGSFYVSAQSGEPGYHLSSSGTVLNTFVGADVSYEGIGLSPDGNTVYLDDQNSTKVYEFSTGGTQLGTFSLTNPSGPIFLTVVPEPTFVGLLALMAPILLGRGASS